MARVRKSAKGDLGQLIKETTKITQIVGNKAGRQLSLFIKCLDGESHWSIADKLESTLEERPNKSIAELVRLLRSEDKCSLGTLIIAARADLANVIRRYTIASLEMGQNLSMIEFAKAMPQATRDLMRHAAAEEGFCYTCLGSGQQIDEKSGQKVPCIMCKGKGKTYTYSEHFMPAVETGLKAMKILEPNKGTQVNVNQQVGVALSGGGLFEKIVAFADQAKGPERTVDVIDVQPENHSSQSG